MSHCFAEDEKLNLLANWTCIEELSFFSMSTNNSSEKADEAKDWKLDNRSHANRNGMQIQILKSGRVKD